jgi:sigma-B regulation protein RsbU (phosphoserine phosphatase)
VQQLESLMEIGTRFNETLDFEEITKVLSRTLMGQFMISKHAIIYKLSGSFKVVLQKSLALTNNDLLLLEEDCMAEIIPENLRHLPLALKIPLIKQNECSGFLLLGKKMMGNIYSEDEISFLKNIASSASSALSNAVLFKETLEKEKLEEELRLAKKIQQELLPKENPVFANYQIIGSNQASKQVGGDYYDFIDLEELGTGIAIGDVSGKGASAALLMSNLQATMLALSSDKNKTITEQIAKANSIIYRNTSPEKYITFFYGIMNDKSLQFTFVNAGHNFPLLFRKNLFTELRTGGIILGMMDHMPYDSETVQLEKDDILVLYTDGITEAQDHLEVEYGEENLKNIIAKNAHLSVNEIHAAIIEDVFKFSPNANDFDDITLIVLKVY